MKFALYIALSYMLGSVPFGIIFGRLSRGIDIRTHGSGNIGAANAFRALGFWGGLTVLMGDVAKGALPVCFAHYFAAGDTLTLLKVISGITAIVGHNYSIFLKFKGGKGIATSFGVIIAINWKIAFICLGIWGLMLLITRYSSVGSLTGSLALPIMMGLYREPLPVVAFGLFACLSAFHAHRENIKRLLAGKELKITEKIRAPEETGKKAGEKESS